MDTIEVLKKFAELPPETQEFFKNLAITTLDAALAYSQNNVATANFGTYNDIVQKLAVNMIPSLRKALHGGQVIG